MQEHSGVLDLERGQLGDIRPLYWQTDTSVSNKSWGYIENDTFKSPQFVVDQLIDIVSKNGNLLMNIDRKSTRLNSSHTVISYAVFCLKKKKKRPAPEA